MRGATLFSGIGAPECAAPEIDWRWGAEIDPFASAVHAARIGTPNLGDVTRIIPDGVEPVDLIVFGSPCQSFSVAGKRLGLDDLRGNLALIALRLIERIRPVWVVFENVPGLLSSDGTGDFGTFLATLGQCGYGFAYRVLDAQYAGVPQRRRRVFVVGYLGDWRPPAAVLFERESLRGDTPPRREAGQGIAASLTRGADSAGAGNYAGRRREDDENLIALPLRGQSQPSHRADSDTYVAHCLNAHPSRIDGESETFITHSLRADGFDASEDGTGRGTPLVAFKYGQGAKARSLGLSDELSPILGSARSGTQLSPAVMFDPTARQPEWSINRPLKTDGPLAVQQAMSVRRLTPRECERLQGFPDDYTLISSYNSRRTGVWGGNRGVADGPRYRALGNSMAVPVVRWILDRIRQFDTLQKRKAA